MNNRLRYWIIRTLFFTDRLFNRLHVFIELLTATARFTDGDAAGLKVAKILQPRFTHSIKREMNVGLLHGWPKLRFRRASRNPKRRIYELFFTLGTGTFNLKKAYFGPVRRADVRLSNSC